MENTTKYPESEALKETLKKVGATFTITYLDEVERHCQKLGGF